MRNQEDESFSSFTFMKRHRKEHFFFAVVLVVSKSPSLCRFLADKSSAEKA